MAKLNLNGNYAEQMLSLYLWGQITPPKPDEMADAKWIRPNGATTTAEIDAQEYMNNVGKNLALGEQRMFQQFFNSKHRSGKKITLADVKQNGTIKGSEIELTHEQFTDLFYKGTPQYNEAQKAELIASQYTLNTGSADYWQRSFVFGSTKMQLDTQSIKYVFDANTG